MGGCSHLKKWSGQGILGILSVKLSTKKVHHRRRGTAIFEPLEARIVLAEDVLGISPPVWEAQDNPSPGFGGPEVDIPRLHSNPGAAKKIYLDFDGHVVIGTAWNTNFNGNNPIHAPAYSTDSDILNFTQSEINRIVEVWERVSEDFAPFQVDVTTEDPGAALFAQGNQAIRVMISTDVDDASIGGTGNRWYSNAGGVAYLNSWTWTSDTPVWVFENNLGNGNAKYVAEAASHEVGHALNLSHDGVSGGSGYYSGHGSGETGWAPIMGVGYYQNLTQWSRGEYPSANQTQNDLNIITGKLPYRVDDHGNAKTNAAAATNLAITGNSVSATGIVERTTDVDVFRLQVASSAMLVLNIDPWFVGPNLDILAELYDSNGGLVASSNPTSALDATIARTIPAGTYTLSVEGIGNGNLTTGYSDYASLGRFTISGVVTPNDPVPGGPYVVADPALDNTSAPTMATYVLSEPLDLTSLSLADVSLTGPGGVDLQSMITGIHFPLPTQMQVQFQPLATAGGYVLTFGPDVRDTVGNAMDQDRDGIPGESPDDRHIFGFSLEVPPVRGDFNGDHLVNAADIDLLCAAIQAGAAINIFDLTQDGALSMADMDEMILNVVGTLYGDANLDRIVDGTDFGIWNASKFSSGGWALGDFSCDGLVDGTDYGIWNNNKFQSAMRSPERPGSPIVHASPLAVEPRLPHRRRLRS